MANSYSQYYITEAEVAKLLGQSGLPQPFQLLFGKDYVSMKQQVFGTAASITEINSQLLIIDERLDIAEVLIQENTDRIDLIEVDLADFHIAFDDHVAATEAHGSTGDIIGTDDYCTDTVGGTVLLADAVADQAASSASVTTSPNSAPVAYSQADAATWVTMLNDLKTQVNQLVTDHNAVVTKLNSILATDRTAKQRAL